MTTLVRAYRQTRLRVFGLRGLSFLWLEITGRCNLVCRHCYTNSSPGRPLSEGMTTADWRRLIDDAAALGCRKLQFIGGEPTVHPELPALIRHATAAGFRRPEVYTNATGISADLQRCLVQSRARVATSVYGPVADVHDEITATPGSFERTVSTIRELRARRIPVRVGIVEMERNRGETSRTRRLVRSLGVRSVYVDSTRAVGRGQSETGRQAEEGELCGQCWRRRLCIDPAGNAYPCVFARFVPLGNYLRDGLAGILNGPDLTAFREALYCGRAGAL